MDGVSDDLRIRVLHLIQGVDIGSESGGAQLHAVRIARLLNRSDFEPAIFGMWRFGSQTETHWLDLLASESLPVNGLTPRTGSLAGDLKKVFRNLWATVTRFRPTIIHSHSERGDLLNSLIRILHPTHPCAVRTVHIDQQWKTRPILGPIVNNVFFPFVFNYEASVSNAVRQTLNTHFRKEYKLGICYNGIDSSAFDKVSSGGREFSIEGVPGEGPRIGIVGRLTEQKGHADLLEAMHLAHHTLHAHLLIIGDGPLESVLKEKCRRLKLQDHVHFLGNREDIWDILPTLDLFVLPSLWEGFPTVLLEAMSQEIPVVATDVSGTRELIETGNTGMLVPSSDPTTLAETIMTMIENPVSARLMAQRARRVAARYTIENTAACYSAIYKQIATRSMNLLKVT